MSTDVKSTEGAQAAAGGDDLIKNLKSEMDRKLGNFQSEMQKQTAELQSLLQTLKKSQAPAPKAEPQDEDLTDLMYTNPKAYNEKIVSVAEQRIEKKLAAREQEQSARQNTLQKLYKDFPELAIDDSPLTKLAIEKFNTMATEYGNNPATYNLAVKEAALELDMKPKSKRPQTDDDYAGVGGSSSGSSRPARRKNEELSDATKELAERMGVDLEKVKARIKTRRNFEKWES